MTATNDTTRQAAGKDAADQALERERASREDVPVKQHNPDDKGLNPGQKGPAQPSGSDAPGSQ